MKNHVEIKSYLVNAISNFYKQHPIILGGPGVKVQVDETMLNHKVLAHRGRAYSEQAWALGIVDFSYKPAKRIMILIPDKSTSTIIPLIKKHVREGSIIYTDEAKVYQALKKNLNFEHKSVIHKYQFVDYINDAHTQNIESYNNKVKMRIKMMKGLRKERREKFLL